MRKCVTSLVTMIFLLSIGGTSYADIDDNQSDYNAVIQDITDIQTTDPSLPTGVPEPKGKVGFIISKLFNANGRISNKVLKPIATTPRSTSNNKLLRWSGGNGGHFVDSIIYDTGTNVGIGTSSPSEKLQVQFGDINLNNAYRIQWGNNATTTDNSDIYGYEGAGGYLTFNVNGANRMYIAGNGNVGIGTTNPSEKLLVSGAGDQRIKIVSTDANSSGLHLRTNGIDWRILNKTTSNDLAITREDIEVFTIRNGGNVGIGTTSPSSGLKLDVEGKVGAIEYCDNNGLNCFTPTSGGVASSIDNLTDGASDGSSVFLGVNSGNADDGSNNSNTGVGPGSLRDNTSGYENTAVGRYALRQNTTGVRNTALGYHAMQANTTGGYNNAIGSYALDANTTGIYNNALGYGSLGANTTGHYNNAIGSYALDANTTGIYNNALGYGSLGANTTGHYNNAIGSYSLDANTTGVANNALGYAALTDNTTGHSNNAIGFYSLYANTTGVYNNAMGRESLRYNTTGNHNNAIGYYSLYANTTGDYNTANGNYTLRNNTTGTQNTADGYAALHLNTTGYYNTANGSHSLYHNTTGHQNSANGMHSLHYNTTGYHNTANGYAALHLNTTGYFNTANGSHSLYANTTGDFNTAYGEYSLHNNTTASYNTAYGSSALRYNTTGQQNTAVGRAALYNNTTGNFNTSVGVHALHGNTTGSDNTSLGNRAGDNITTGSNNIIIGSGIDAPSATGNNQINIGNTIYGDGGNIGIGTSTPTHTLTTNGTFFAGTSGTLQKQGVQIENSSSSTQGLPQCGCDTSSSTNNCYGWSGFQALSVGYKCYDRDDTGSLWYTTTRYDIFEVQNITVGATTAIATTIGGNVGIGTLTPAKKLDVAGDINFSGDIYKNGVLVDFAGKFIDGTDTDDAVYTTGDVGIGTTTPGMKLDVVGDIRGYNVAANCVGAGCVTSTTPPASGNWQVNGDLTINGNLDITGNLTAVVRPPSIDSSFDCTFGGEFSSNEAYKFNLGNGVYKCIYMFYVGNAYSNEQDFIYMCPSKNLRDGNARIVPLAWKKDSATWHTMWDYANSIANHGEFKFYESMGDYSAHYNMGINLIYHYSYPYKVYKQYGAFNYNGWTNPMQGNTERSGYSANSFVICEL